MVLIERRTVNPLYLKGAKSANRMQEVSSPPKSAPTSPQKEHEQSVARSLDKSSTYEDVMRGLAEADSDSGSNKVSRTNSFSSEQSSDDEAPEIKYMVNPKTGYGKIPILVNEERSLHRLSTSSSTDDHPQSSSSPASPTIPRRPTQNISKKAYSHYGSVNGVKKLSELSFPDESGKDNNLVVKRPPKGQYGKIPAELQED